MESKIEELKNGILVDREHDIVTKMEEFAKQCEINPELAKDFLQKTGIYTEDGKLTENYK